MRVSLPSPSRPLRALVGCVIAIFLLGLAPTPASAQSGARAAIHVVAWGETLSTIAGQHGVSSQIIVEANSLTQPDQLAVGQQLVIPGAAAVFEPPRAAGTHVVQPGEGLYRIALQYGVTVDDLMAANGLSNPDQIYAGQVLVIPGAQAAPPVTSAPAATGGPVGAIHVVQPGETLFRISQQYGIPVSALSAANGLLNPAQIYVGQTLTIPGTGGPVSAPAAPPAAPESVPALSGTHIVQPGETLGLIATRYGISVAALAQANNISNPSVIYWGQQLVVPGAGTTGPAAQPAPAPSSGVHIVQQGDTLFRIALSYGLSVNDLMAANGLSSNTIYTGQALTIPGGSGGPVAAPIPVVPAALPTLLSGKQIVVKLSTQRVYAYENGQLMREFVVSTGLPATPTVTGDYSIYVKYDAQRMSGPGYDLPNVPWVMYFYKGYGLHGTYWHNNFGQPMSHGCVNMRTPEAEWLYAWAPIGTAVHVEW